MATVSLNAVQYEKVGQI